MRTIIHILDQGLTLCGFGNGIPQADWAAGHGWTNAADPDLVSCARCRAKAGLNVTTKHWLQRIDNIYAVISEDKDGEGVVSTVLGNTMMPLIAADETRLKNIMPLARDIAKTTGRKMRLVKFTTREVVEEL